MARRDVDDEDAPWLAEAAPAPRTEVSRRSVFWTLFIVLALATVAIVGLILLMAKKDGGSTQGYMNAEQAPVITAEAGPYKVKPADPAGMRIDGIDGTMYTAGEGIDQGSAIDPTLAPEVPLPRPGTAGATPTESGPPRDLLPSGVTEVPAIATVPAATLKPLPAPFIRPPAVTTTAPAVIKPPVPQAAPTKPPLVTIPKPAPIAAPAPAPAGAKSGSIQLGAFSSEEKANAVWASLAGKHGLSGKRIIAVEKDGKTLYRLRAASADTAATCARLKAAGDACAAVE